MSAFSKAVQFLAAVKVARSQGADVIDAWMLGYDAVWPISTGIPYLNWGEMTPRGEDQLIGCFDRVQLRQRCKRLYRNDPHVHAAVERIVDHVVGPEGPRPAAHTRDSEWNEAAEQVFIDLQPLLCANDWALRKNTRCLERCRWVDGDAFIVKRADGRMAFYEGEHCFTPKDLSKDLKARTIDGVLLNPDGSAKGYFIHERCMNGSFDSNSKWKMIPVESCYHWFDPFRFAMYRGVPGLTAGIETMTYLQDGKVYTLRKWKSDANMTWLLKGAGGRNLLNMQGRTTASRQPIEQTGRPRLIEVPGGGMVVALDSEKQEGIESFASNTPSNNFEPFVTFNIRTFCSLTGFPYEFIMLDASKGNFAQAQVALLLAKRSVEVLQEDHFNFYSWLWAWAIPDAIRRGELPEAPVDKRTGRSEWDKVTWIPPPQEWVTPLQQANAVNVQLINGTRTFGDGARENGRTLEQQWRARAREVALKKRIAEEVSAETGYEVLPDEIATVSVLTKGAGKATEVEPTEADDAKEEAEPDKKKGGEK